MFFIQAPYYWESKAGLNIFKKRLLFLRGIHLFNKRMVHDGR